MELVHENYLFSGTEDSDNKCNQLFKAGKITFIFEKGMIRDLSYDGNIVISQIYFALRNQNWETIPFEISDVCIKDSHFISFHAHHRKSPVDFMWIGTIRMDSDDTLEFSFEGNAYSDFLRNRIGFCVLHPLNVAGKVCSVMHCDGQVEKGVFPFYISPHQPFRSIQSISHLADNGTEISVSFQGDEFEMEDQRNWTDASFKTYCTPLEKPFPVKIHKGDRVSQSVKVCMKGKTEYVRIDPSETDVADFSQAESHDILSIGSCYTKGLSARENRRIKMLNLGHVRVDVNFSNDDALEILKEALMNAASWDAKLLICLHFTDEFENELQQFAAAVKKAGNLILGICVFKDGEKVTQDIWIKLVREKLSGTCVPVGSGTDGFFAQLNRERPEPSLLDFAIYSNNPQVHAFDNLSLAETLQGQESNVCSARQFLGDVPVYVSPVTLKMRWNPDATDEELPLPGVLPKQVDTRQMSLFGAAWTLGSIGAMIRAGADLVTYYDLCGWKGIMEREEGCDMPELFPSKPGMVFPMYFIFYWLGEFKGGRAYVARTDTCRLTAILLEKEGKRRLLTANLTGGEMPVHFRSISGIGQLTILSKETVSKSVENPDVYLLTEPKTTVKIDSDNGISLPAYAIACIDYNNI